MKPFDITVSAFEGGGNETRVMINFLVKHKLPKNVKEFPSGTTYHVVDEVSRQDIQNVIKKIIEDLDLPFVEVKESNNEINKVDVPLRTYDGSDIIWMRRI